MLRLTVLYIFVGGLMLLSVRRWFLALCGLMFLTVLIQHPSMPREMAGIQGLNPWNATFFVIFVSWMINRRFESGRSSASPRLLVGFAAFSAMLILTGLFAITDVPALQGDGGARYTARDIFVDTVINPMKYLLVGVMFFDGATTRERVKQALFAGVGSGLCYAAMMYKTLKLGVFTMDYSAARRATDKLVGLYANDMAEVLAFTLWAAVLLGLMIDRNWLRAVWLLAVVAVVPAFFALKSRAGMLAFSMTAMVLGLLKWRRILFAMPVALLLTVAFAPDVVDRVTTGIHAESAGENDWEAISAGRVTYLWPAALEQISHSPIFGHGRYAILRTGAFDTILDAVGRVPTHPHNSYLEVLLDAGVVGLLTCLAVMFGLTRAAWMLLRERNDRLITAVGAVAMIAVVTELSAGIAGSSFYPTQSAVPYLCVWGVAMRLATEKVVQTADSAQRCMAAFSTNQPMVPAMYQSSGELA